jgi:hypothetical protein
MLSGMEESLKQESGLRPAEAAAAPLAPVRQWRVHVGAHKTATTHLQETLTLVRAELAGRGIDYLPNQLVRHRKLSWTLWRRRPLARLPLIGPARMREAIEATLEPLRLGPDIVALSEENILGVPHQVLTPTFYPQADLSIARLASLAGRAELELFLSIRSYEALLPSAYVETLKHGTRPEGGFAAVKERLLAVPPSWFDLVGRIRAAAPGVRLRVWRQEDYRSNAHAIMQAFCGAPLGELPAISDPAWTRTPSAAAVAEAERLPADLPRPERLRRVMAIFTASLPKGDRFQPLSEAEQRHLQARYEADLARIAEAWPDVLMRFPSTAKAA